MKNVRMKIFVLIGVLFLRMPSVYAQTTEGLINSANVPANQENGSQSIADYTKAIEADPNNAEVYNNRGLVYDDQGSFPEAISDYTKAIEINPNRAEVYSNRGNVYLKQGNLPQAITDYTKAIELDSHFSEAYNNRAVSFFQSKEYDKAWADVHKAEELGNTPKPDFIEALKKASGKDQ